MGKAVLNRQKSLLCMIEKAARPVQHLELTKWAFLLAHETPSKGGRSFYQFVPYRLGPFSFCLYHEVGGLVRNGYLVDAESDGRKTWWITGDVNRPTGDLRQGLPDDIARIVERFETTSTDALLDYVYERFPWFTVNSTKRKLQPRPVAASAVFTVGYEGRSVDGLLDLLMRAGINRVLDVRANPVSRRYGFHRRTLSRLCKNLQLEYVHFPELGIPSAIRRELQSPADYASLFLRYQRDALERKTGALDEVARMMAERPSVLLCMEADARRCHRGLLADAIAQRSGLRVQHLGAAHEARV